eukprot:TRINITY_DN11465_c1_g1_i2.p1 TRINITY_DN11465_c1_g1~~TRINITY_DN11465_c1_g1_i2.p1  ORF type:complete len:375 (-),score=86.90 TRINITY_DN11465_c1_g1_i2:314-1438(-)
MARLVVFSCLVLLALFGPSAYAGDDDKSKDDKSKAKKTPYKSSHERSDDDCDKVCKGDKQCATHIFDLTGVVAASCGKDKEQSCFLYDASSGGTGEPHFHGADESRFDFSGVPDTTYTLFTDAHLQMNAFFGGRYGQWGEDSHHSITWMRKVAIFQGHHTLVLEAREGPESAYGNGYMAHMSFDGEDFALSQAGDVAELADGVKVTWVAAKEKSVDDLVDVYEVEVPQVLKMKLTLRPEVAFLRTQEDGTVHFDIDVEYIKLSTKAHGILGQTYRKDHAGRFENTPQVYSELLHTFMVAAPDAEGFLDGKAADYATSALLKTDSPVSRFVRAKEIDEELASFAQAMSSSSSFSAASMEDKSIIRLARKLLGVGL